MLVIHANWSGGALTLWAESRSAYQAAAEHGDDGPHPFAAPVDAVRAVLVDAGVPEHVLAPGDDLAIRLPVLSSGRPSPSDRLAGGFSDDDDGGVATIGIFTVPTLRVDPAQTLSVLLVMEGLESNEGRVFSPSVRYWGEVARFATELLIDQRFIPTMVQPKSGGLTAGWRPWLHDEAARSRVGALIEAMPPIVRAAMPETNGQSNGAAIGTGDDDARPWPILDDALTAMADATIRRVLVDDDYGDAIDGRDPAADPHVAWLHGLLGERTNLDGNIDVTTELLRDASAWIAGLDEGVDDRPLRLVLCLHEPPAEDFEDDEIRPDDNASWTVTFHLRRAGEQAIAIDADQLWSDPSLAAAAGGGDGKAEELLLAELARAGRLCPPVETALSNAHPESVEITTAEAYAFLAEQRELLEEAGIDVRIPEWWGQPAAQLSARLHVDAPDIDAAGMAPGASGQGASLLGLNSLVKYRWQVAVGDRVLTMDEFRALTGRASAGASLVRINGQWVEVRPDQIAEAAQTLEERPGGEMSLLEAIQVAHGVSGRRLGLPVHGMDASGWVADLLGASSDETRMPMLKQPPGFDGELRPYQLAGLSWLAWLDRFGLGACLADDMGLGKTIQLIALLIAEREAQAEGEAMLPPTLLIVPTSVVGNWKREIERFSEGLKILVHHGPERTIGDRFIDEVNEHDVVITTYSLISRDRESVLKVDWHRVVLDEAQYIKNPPTKQTSTIRALRTTRRVALTGTPVENRLSELWSIMEFCNPGYLGQAGEFRRRFAVPIERHRDPASAERLRQLVRPFILRRLKTDPAVIDDLPSCVTTKEYATLSTDQAKLYESTVNDMLGQVGGAEGIRRRGLVLATLVKLKQICDHPALIEAGDDKSTQALEAAAGANIAARSGKCDRLRGMLEEVHAVGDRALIFTQFRRMGHLLCSMIKSEFDLEPLFLHGGTPPPRRQQMIDRFQSGDPRVPFFVLSLKAGGVGLNLTAANHVFHFDRWWNPAVENQATDRAFRIGQTQTVHVHKFICMGTLEERVDQMIEQKTQLAQNIIGSGEDWLTELSTGQLRNLLRLRDGAMEGDE